MRFFFTLLPALCSTVWAQDVVTAYLNGLSQANEWGYGLNFTPVASIQSYSSSTTVMSLGCAPGAAKRSCPVADGINYTIISGNTYIGAWSMTELPSWSMGFTCVHNSAAAEVKCGEEKSDNGEFGYQTMDMVYEAVPGDFVTASIVGGKEMLRTTGVPASAAATQAGSRVTISGATATPTSSDAKRRGVGGSTMFAMAGVVLLAAW